MKKYLDYELEIMLISIENMEEAEGELMKEFQDVIFNDRGTKSYVKCIKDLIEGEEKVGKEEDSLKKKSEYISLIKYFLQNMIILKSSTEVILSPDLEKASNEKKMYENMLNNLEQTYKDRKNNGIENILKKIMEIKYNGDKELTDIENESPTENLLEFILKYLCYDTLKTPGDNKVLIDIDNVFYFKKKVMRRRLIL